MNRSKKNLSILGSTGSVGAQTLEVARSYPENFNVVCLGANKNTQILEEQILEFQPQAISCDYHKELNTHGEMSEKVMSLTGIATHEGVDTVVVATSGNVALIPTFEAIKKGKNIAIANKETIIMAGEQLTSLAESNSVNLMPIDSEPSAIWQCLRGEGGNISKLIITASGGPFRNNPVGSLSNVTPSNALQHPTWEMGPKITVDSATMMNKAFEVIEARWLFDVPWENIEVIVHPESIIHSMVEFSDGSTKAQLSYPDMRIPIKHALFFPDRAPKSHTNPFDPKKTKSLTFEILDQDRYPCFEIALKIAKRGGTWPSALSGADEAAVEAFLDSRIKFTEIHTLIEQAIQDHESIINPKTTDMLKASHWAYDRVSKLTSGK
ncbi:MAG TPA: 1-deoxy-D-xylulose-5-phosphate reductoisomerase [Dehalococcoidia bacterium]|jgi:1-deoxy-D-xylulose-5-phosphate reductoisomerase|nr:1-deoxy-D-xylulose-5-phosphate reductoisomerase [Dehalococcoidia bacterium]